MKNKTFTHFVKKTVINLAVVLGFIAVSTSAQAALVPVTFKVDMTGVDMSAGTGVYVLGELGGTMQWKHQTMTLEQNNVYAVTVSIEEGTQLYYYFTINTLWAPNQLRETYPIPAPCGSTGSEKTGGWAGDRFLTVPTGGTTVLYPYSGCGTATKVSTNNVEKVACTPNPAADKVTVTLPESDVNATIDVVDLSGKQVSNTTAVAKNKQVEFNVSNLPSGIYVVVIKTQSQVYTSKLNVK